MDVGWVVVLPDTTMFLLLVDGERVRVFQDDSTLPTCHRGGHTVGFDVFLELHVPGCSVATHGTFVGFLFGVCPHVRLQLVSLHAGKCALVTAIGVNTFMSSNMQPQHAGTFGRIWTNMALMAANVLMNVPNMRGENHLPKKHFTTFRTLKFSLTCISMVIILVFGEVRKILVTFLTEVHLLGMFLFHVRLVVEPCRKPLFTVAAFPMMDPVNFAQMTSICISLVENLSTHVTNEHFTDIWITQFLMSC